ncbi:MAG: hypothetical protein AAF499_06220 [Pseudomonadota bacterium]
MALSACSSNNLDDDPMLRPPQLIEPDEEAEEKETASLYARSKLA